MGFWNILASVSSHMLISTGEDIPNCLISIRTECRCFSILCRIQYLVHRKYRQIKPDLRWNNKMEYNKTIVRPPLLYWNLHKHRGYHLTWYNSAALKRGGVALFSHLQLPSISLQQLWCLSNSFPKPVYITKLAGKQFGKVQCLLMHHWIGSA